jgi:hypothetical protein
VVWELSYGWYFTFVQGLVYLGVISCYGFRAKHILNPWRTYCKLSAVLIGSHGLTKGSLMFLNYPAQIMFKSTKVVQPQVLECFFPLRFCVVSNQDLVKQFFFLGLGLKHGRMDVSQLL